MSNAQGHQHDLMSQQQETESKHISFSMEVNQGAKCEQTQAKTLEMPFGEVDKDKENKQTNVM